MLITCEEDVEAAHKKVEYYADKAQAYEEDIEEMKKKMAEMEDEIASYEKKRFYLKNAYKKKYFFRGKNIRK